MAYVNLWELITTVGSPTRDLPNMKNCQEVESLAGKGAFCGMQELSLEVTEHAWKVSLFPAETGDRVELTVDRWGHITICRLRERDGIIESRELRF